MQQPSQLRAERKAMLQGVRKDAPQRKQPQQQEEPQHGISGPTNVVHVRGPSPAQAQSQPGDSTVKISIDKTEEQYMPGGQRKFTAYLITVTIATPVVVRYKTEPESATAAPAADEDVASSSSSSQPPLGKSVRRRVGSVDIVSPELWEEHQRKKQQQQHEDPPEGVSLPDDPTGTLLYRGQSLDRSDPVGGSASGRPQEDFRTGVKRRIIVVSKRYSDFLAFHQSWRKQHPDLQNQAFELSFPKKQWWKNFNPELIKQRKQQLNSYMQRMLCFPPLALELYRFLQIEQYVTVASSSQASTPAGQGRQPVHQAQQTKPGPQSPGHGGSPSSAVEIHETKSFINPATQFVMHSYFRPRSSKTEEDLRDETDEPPELLIPQRIVCEVEDENERGSFDRLHLFRAVLQGDVEAVKYCLENGVDVHCRMGYVKLGKTPVEWAALKQHMDVVDLLVSHGAKLQQENRFVAPHHMDGPIARKLGLHPLS